MGETYSNNDIKILEIISSHLTKALYNYKLFKNVEEKNGIKFKITRTRDSF